MANYSIWVLPESMVTISNAGILDGITQGDGSHLLGETLTLDPGMPTELDIRDGGSDANFDDNDSNQRLRGRQELDGISYNNNTVIEAEFQIDVEAPDGTIYTMVGVNLNNSSPSYATIEGLAFIDAAPPRGVPLTVIETREGPGSFGQPSIPAGDYVPCFCSGTRIETTAGPRPVERIVPGDRVLTDLGGTRTVRWVGCRTLDHAALSTQPKLRPVRIVAGALGQGLPKRDLLVSRQHRMLVRSRIAERMFGACEVLIPAIKLTAMPGIFVDDSVTEVSYVHLLFDDHEVILAEGAPSESLFVGPGAMQALGAEAREEILTLFPELDRASHVPLSARPIPLGRLQKRLIDRHARNRKPLLDGQDGPMPNLETGGRAAGNAA